jgi:hypothetical protein
MLSPQFCFWLSFRVAFSASADQEIVPFLAALVRLPLHLMTLKQILTKESILAYFFWDSSTKFLGANEKETLVNGDVVSQTTIDL